MASALESYRREIEACCRRGDHDAKIVRTLRSMGCQVGRERIRTWVKKETEAGRLPAREPSKRGRPPAKNAAPHGPVSVGTSPQGEPKAESTAVPKTFSATAFASAFDIPIDSREDLDLLAWARKLGSKRVQSLSDLELFLIESLEKEWRDHPQKWSQKWVQSVRRCAECLREQMIEAAKMQELLGGIGAKKE
jgi:hypothetical protein